MPTLVRHVEASSFAEYSEHYTLLVNSNDQTQWEVVHLWAVAATSQNVPEDQEIPGLKLSEFLGSPNKVTKVIKDALATAAILVFTRDSFVGDNKEILDNAIAILNEDSSGLVVPLLEARSLTAEAIQRPL